MLQDQRIAVLLRSNCRQIREGARNFSIMVLKMGMYAGGRALAMMRPGEHGADHGRALAIMQPGEQPGEHGADQLAAIISHFRWTIVFSVGLLYKSPSRRTRQTQFATALSLQVPFSLSDQVHSLISIMPYHRTTI